MQNNGHVNLCVHSGTAPDDEMMKMRRGRISGRQEEEGGEGEHGRVLTEEGK
jgi:hypothetical protein